MANTVEIGPRCKISFVVFCVDGNLRNLLQILADNGRHYTFEKPSTLLLWKISVRCIVLQAHIVWKLIGHLTTEYKV